MRPTSDEAKKAAGTYTPKRKRTPLNLPVGCPDAPEWMSRGAKEFWDHVIIDLSKSGVLAKIDWILLAPLCELLAEYSFAPKEFPVGKLKEMRLIANELGCSTGARLKMKIPEGTDVGDEKPDKETACPKDAKVVSISRLLSGTPRASSVEKSQPADMSDSPANAS